jgi:alkylhydroperoxidase/carboxymuconolactone decarboxylase family protein
MIARAAYPSTVDPGDVARTLRFCQDLGLISVAEGAEALALFDSDFAFADALGVAESVHLHIKVEDTAALAHEVIRAHGASPESEAEGYVKYRFPGGLNMIFSSIDIAEDDLLVGEPAPALPVMDHLGIDLRTETAPVRAVFDAAPGVAGDRGWRHVAQGGAGIPVYCCHTEVKGKHWVYPPTARGDNTPTHTRPIEIAFGELELHAGKMGCDLRPIDPAHPRAGEAGAALAACAAAHGEPADPAAAASAGNGAPSYYQPADLTRFAEVGRFAKPLMDRFWVYYNATFAQDGALTVREKALIGLAVAHSKQCPYCIDSFTNSCVEAGVSVEGMHEAVHAAAALGAGIDLVHGVQMQNALRVRGAI